MNARRFLFLLTCIVTCMTLPAWAQTSPPVAPHVPSERDALTPAQKKAETNVRKLLERAHTEQRTGQFRNALGNYELAIEVLEEAYGPDHPRLADALGEVAEMFLTQYDVEYLVNKKRVASTLKSALDTQERIVRIYEHAVGVDPALRVTALNRLGGCYLLMKKDKEALAAYADAWRVQAAQFSRDSADEMFAQPELIGFYHPHNYGGHEPWTITVTYDVGADGRVTVLDVQGDDAGDVRRQMRNAYEQARARPPIVGGTATEARSLSASWSYRRDGGVTRLQ